MVVNNSISKQQLTQSDRSIRPYLMSGPCSAESREQVLATAEALRETGIHLFRAGIWKPRTRPNGFEGRGETALDWMIEAREKTGLPVATEVANTAHVEACLKKGIDVMWIGARTAVSPFAVQEIADALAGTKVPMMVKNPMHADLSLWIGAIERVRTTVQGPVWAIHRGFSRYGQTEYRNAPMWEIPIGLRATMPEIPVLCDPSHIAGKRSLIPAVAQKAMDLGMQGLMVESHIDPNAALSDAQQQLTPTDFSSMVRSLMIRNSHQLNVPLEELSSLRLQMDSIDEQVIQLLQTRMDLARQIGKFKWDHGMTILQLDRLKEVFETRGKWAQDAGLGKEFIKNYLEHVHKESIRVQNDEMTSKKNNL